MSDYNIFLIGFMGAGKSTVAAELERRLGMERAEMDEMIVERFGMPIPEIFEKYGEAYFRDAESETVISLQQRKNTVVSCGGGVVMRDENVGHMKRGGRIVLLTATPETIFARVRHSNDRPILNGNMNVEFIRDLMEKRRARYEAAADVVVATDGKSVQQICGDMLEKLKALDEA